MAHFAWANPETGFVASQPQSPADLLGFVQPYPGFLWRAVRDCRIIRPGYEVTLFANGDFYARFAAGAAPGQRVFASALDGAPISGEADDAEATPWHVAVGCAPGDLAIISQWSIPQ